MKYEKINAHLARNVGRVVCEKRHHSSDIA